MPASARLLIPVVIAAAVTFAGPAPGAMRGGGGGHGHPHGGWHHPGWSGHGHQGHGPHVFIDGGFFFGAPLAWGYGPLFYGGDYYPYPPAYVYPPYDAGPYYYPPPPPDTGELAESAPSESGASAPSAPASYGLVQLRGVPDGASVDLDGRFWLTAEHLGDRWLALPEGAHSIAVRNGDAPAVTRDVSVSAGGNLTVDFRR